ncbi:MAG: nucleoside-diphosphate kinase [Euryarchaeota archaeon]|nr:nucleoside-diphosphate kinase [Euryarchaeota archaeon]
MIERSFVMLKPDAVLRRLMGDIINRFEARGLKIVGVKMLNISRELAEEHYAEHEQKPFFNDLVEYITSGSTLAMVVEGDDCINLIRKMVGSTNPKESDIGTIRGDYALETGRNIIHASDSPKSAKREISLFFDDSEICEYKMPDEHLVYENI